ISSQQRSSNSPSFEGLHNLKRSTDPVSVARRQSLHEQKPTAGFFGQMWHKYVYSSP
ncbi:uncharacterized protein BCR38DRAFT_308781, partial [Pseudomassariella vexata]